MLNMSAACCSMQRPSDRLKPSVTLQDFVGKTPGESAAQHKWEQHFAEQQHASSPEKEVPAYSPAADKAAS